MDKRVRRGSTAVTDWGSEARKNLKKILNGV